MYGYILYMYVYYHADDNCRANATVTDLPDFVELMERMKSSTKTALLVESLQDPLHGWLMHITHTRLFQSNSVCVS